MSRIDLPEPTTVRLARKLVAESLAAHGEECVVLSAYHITTDPTAVRCSTCFDTVYNASNQFACPTCYTTTFNPPFKMRARAWGMFTDQVANERYGDKGEWNPDRRSVQLESAPVLLQHDFVIRVSDWTLDHKPNVIEGVYVVDAVTVNSLRTGNQYGQRTEIIGQKVQVNRLSPSHPLYAMPLVGLPMPRVDGLVR